MSVLRSNIQCREEEKGRRRRRRNKTDDTKSQTRDFIFLPHHTYSFSGGQVGRRGNLAANVSTFDKGRAQPPHKNCRAPTYGSTPASLPPIIHPSFLQTGERGRVVSNALFCLSSSPRFLQASGKPRDGPSDGQGPRGRRVGDRGSERFGYNNRARFAA